MQNKFNKILVLTAVVGVFAAGMSVVAQENGDYERGLMYIHSGDTTAAMESFEASIKNYKNVAESYKNIALIKYAEGNVEDAIVALDQSLLAEPNVENYVLQAGYLNRYGSRKAALRVINKAIDMEPTNPELYEIKASINKHKGAAEYAGADLYMANELKSGRVEVVRTPRIHHEYKIEPIFHEIRKF